MQFTLAVVSAFLAASISAAPATFPTIRVQLANDFSGANTDVYVVANDAPNDISTLFAGSAVDLNGAIIATSVQLTQFVDNISCIITAGGADVATVTTDDTFSFFNGNDKAVETNLTGDVLTCEVV